MARVNDTFHLEFETREYPGKIRYVEVTINHRITSDPNKVFHIALRDHPLYAALVRYVNSNPLIPKE